MSTLAFHSGTFSDIYTSLLALPAPLLNPAKPSNKSLTDSIASLYLHPSLEIALHILNNDLVSAHFLVRHMEAAPAHEAMFLHGILHRIEGDYDNARAWYRDISDSEVFKAVWKGEGEGLELIDRIEAWVKVGKNVAQRATLERDSIGEIKRVVDFCVAKFSNEPWQNVKGEWHYAEGEGKKIKGEMILGEAGHRSF